MAIIGIPVFVCFEAWGCAGLLQIYFTVSCFECIISIFYYHLTSLFPSFHPFSELLPFFSANFRDLVQFILVTFHNRNSKMRKTLIFFPRYNNYLEGESEIQRQTLNPPCQHLATGTPRPACDQDQMYLAG